MSNILIVPNSGSIYFSTGLVGSSTIPNLSSGVAFQFDNSAGVNITSYATGINDNDRFSVDGYNGRLFNVSDNLTGVIFSVNDAAGLPIIEVDSSTVDRITMGTYASNTFVINDNRVGIGTGVPAAKLDIFDNVLAGSAGLAGSALNLAQTWNTSGTPTAIKLNVIDTASNAASNLLELWSNNIKRFEVRKDGNFFNAFSFVFGPSTTSIRGQLGGNGLGLSSLASISWAPLSDYSSVGDVYNVADLRILRESAGVLAQRNGSNPQEFRLYNTSTSSTNFERLNIKWDTNVLKIGTEKGSAGGVARAMEFQTDGATRMTVTSGGNFGIGTTTASAKLQIIHDASTNPIDIRRTGFLDSQLFTISNLGDITGGAAVFTPKLGHMVPALTVTGNGTLPSAIFQTGNVGIGTTAPTNLLHLKSEVGNGSAQLLVQNDGNTAPVIQFLSRKASGAAVVFQESLCRISALGSKSSTVNLQAGYIDFQASASPAAFSNVLPARINFVTFIDDTYATYSNSITNGAFVAGGTTGQFIFNQNDNIGGNYGPDTGLSRLSAGKIGIGNATAGSSGGTLIAGSIGIGTTTPASKLTVTGGDIEITDVTGGVIFKTPDGTKRYRMTIDNAGAPVFTLLA